MSNREDLLKSYSNRRIRDSWAALGSNTITSNTKIYNSNLIYKLNIDGVPLNGCLLFCKEDLIGCLKN